MRPGLARGEHRRAVDLALGIPPLARLVRDVALDELLDDVAERLVVLVVDVALHVRLPLVFERPARRHACGRSWRAALLDLTRREHVQTARACGIRSYGSWNCVPPFVGCRNRRAPQAPSADVSGRRRRGRRTPRACASRRRGRPRRAAVRCSARATARRGSPWWRCARPRSGRSSRTPTRAPRATRPAAIAARSSSVPQPPLQATRSAVIPDWCSL